MNLKNSLIDENLEKNCINSLVRVFHYAENTRLRVTINKEIRLV